MQRDSIFINGVLHVGSEESYEQIMQAASDACRDERERAEKIRATTTTRNGGKGEVASNPNAAAVTTTLPDEKETLERFVRMVLRCSNRTTSGGDAYDVLFRLVRHSEFR
jgi:hypothetical protein